MDSKQRYHVVDHQEAAPPSYSEAASPNPLFPYSASSTSQYYGAQIQDQLRSLTAQIRSAQAQIYSIKHGNDERILELFTTEIQNFFSDFAHSGVQRGTLILVPAAAVQAGATPMEYDFRDQEEYDRVARVKSKEEVGDGQWFWRDEDMAMRLARYLSPTSAWTDLPSRSVAEGITEESALSSNQQVPRLRAMRPKKKVPTEEIQAPKRRLFGRQRGTITSIEKPPTAEEKEMKAALDSKLANEHSEDKVDLAVKAEEISFRTENEMGIFETQRGWAVVLKMKVELRKV